MIGAVEANGVEMAVISRTALHGHVKAKRAVEAA